MEQLNNLVYSNLGCLSTARVSHKLAKISIVTDSTRKVKHSGTKGSA